MTRRHPTPPSDLVADPGVLEDRPVLEIFGFGGVSKVGGAAILPHRGSWLAARESGIEARGWFENDLDTDYGQAVVHLQKGRDATRLALAEAWRRLDIGGRLLLVGGNALGVKTAVKRLSNELDAPAEILANRARARVACWRRDTSPGPICPEVTPIEVETAADRFTLRSAAGVFSADAVDPGTAMLLEHLDHVEPPRRIFDPGCGLGVLGLSALRRWPDARALLADVDHRAVACASGSADDLDLSSRAELMWWDATRDPVPSFRCDLVLLNPPFHTGVPVDLQPARAIFRAIDSVLAPGGRALVVANRTLPWERDLREIGGLRPLADQRGYKVLEVTR
jgi:16S rRNA (guanine1207-N2)-methyltransferase